MKRYSITYTETYVHTFDVFAENPEQAEELAHKMIATEEIDLSHGFCADSEMTVVSHENNIWHDLMIGNVVKKHGLTSRNELTKEHLQSEISEVQETIKSERIWNNNENVACLEEYIEYLEDLIEDMEV